MKAKNLMGSLSGSGPSYDFYKLVVDAQTVNDPDQSGDENSLG